VKLTKEVLERIVKNTLEESRFSQQRTREFGKPLSGEISRGETFYEVGDEDTIPDITPEEREKVKEKFFQLLRTAKVGRHSLKQALLFLILNLDQQKPTIRESVDPGPDHITSHAATQKNAFIGGIERDDWGQVVHMFIELFDDHPNDYLEGRNFDRFKNKNLYNKFKQYIVKKINDVFRQLLEDYEKK